MKESTFNTTPYIEIPYTKDGRTVDGCDCYGMTILVYKTELGIDLLDYKADCGVDPHALEAYHEQFDQIAIQDARLFDILAIDHRGSFHCGVVSAPFQFLHTLENYGAAVSRISAWQRRIVGVYRLKENT